MNHDRYRPLVSIIIPVFNGSNYLHEAINSAINQTYSNIEIIVVNDGSTDSGKTESVALSYGKSIRYILKENGGVSSALNTGIEAMKGEWFSWLSHDDLYEPDKIECQINEALNFKEPNLIIASQTKFIDASSNEIKQNILIAHLRSIKPGIYSSSEMLGTLLSGKTLNGCALLVAKKTIEHIGYFNEALKYTQDLDYWLRACLKETTFIFSNEKKVFSRIHSEQQTLKIRQLHQVEIKVICKKLLIQSELFEPTNKSRLLYFAAENKCNLKINADYKKSLKNEYYSFKGKSIGKLKAINRRLISMLYRKE